MDKETKRMLIRVTGMGLALTFMTKVLFLPAALSIELLRLGGLL